MRFYRRLIFGILFLFLSHIPAYALPAYSIQPYPIPPAGANFFPNSVNASGVAVGGYAPGINFVASLDSIAPITIDAVNFVSLTVDAGWRINDAGTITGEATLPNGFQGTFIQTPTSTTFLNGANIPENFVEDMNNSDAVVGDDYIGSGPDAGNHSFLYAGNTFVRLGSLNGPNGIWGPNFSMATAINDSGVIAGTSQAPDSSFPAVIFHDGQVTSLGTPPGYSTALVRAINNAGTIVGEASDVAPFLRSPSPSALFLYSNGQYTLVPSLGGRIMPLDINSAGTVVGIYRYADLTLGSAPFIYQDGTLVDLNSLIDPSSGWILGDADSINDSGQIAGAGLYLGQRRAFLLTPLLPDPSGLSLILIPFIIMFGPKPKTPLTQPGRSIK